MKKLFNKKIVLFLFVFILLGGGTQVYAATALNTNIISLVMDGFKSIKGYFIQASDDQTKQIETDSSNDMKQYINNLTQQTINDLEAHKNSELDKANNEIDSYANEMKKQIDSAVVDQENETKKLITEEIDNNVVNIKDNLNKDMEKYIKEFIKK